MRKAVAFTAELVEGAQATKFSLINYSFKYDCRGLRAVPAQAPKAVCGHRSGLSPASAAPCNRSRRVRRDDMDVIRPHVTGLLHGAMRPIPRLCWSERDQQ